MTTGSRRRSVVFLAASLLAAGAVSLLASCQNRSGSEGPGKVPMQSIGRLQIGVANTPDPPHTGDNALTIIVRDAAGKPMHGTAVDAVVSMPAIPAIPDMPPAGWSRPTDGVPLANASPGVLVLRRYAASTAVPSFGRARMFTSHSPFMARPYSAR